MFNNVTTILRITKKEEANSYNHVHIKQTFVYTGFMIEK